MKRWAALGSLAIGLLVVVFIIATNSGNERQDVADTAKTNTREIIRLKRQVLPIQRVLVNKDILRVGPRGLVGGPGPPGQAGKAGTSGRAGLPGSMGAQGLAGLLGAAGQDGAQGEPGAIGEQGSQGEQGPQGTPGTDGAPGPPVQSFTFTHLGITYVCTDPEQDGSYACQPSP